MKETPDSAAATSEDLLRQTRRIHQELERLHGITRRQLQEEWKTVEAAIYVSLDTTDDESGQVAGRAALDPPDRSGRGGSRTQTTFRSRVRRVHLTNV